MFGLVTLDWMLSANCYLFMARMQFDQQQINKQKWESISYTSQINI